jgi:hypothetical protein
MPRETEGRGEGQRVFPSMLRVPGVRETDSSSQKILSTEVTQGPPEGEQKRDQEQHCEGDPPPSGT